MRGSLAAFVFMLGAVAMLLTAGCAALEWDCFCYGGAPSEVRFINAQLLAELAREEK